MAIKKTAKRSPARTSKKGRPAGGETAREKILEAAYRVVQQHGAGHLTLENVAWEAGVSKGGLLYHFRSKDDLIRGMVEEHVRQEERHMHENLGEDPDAKAILRFVIDTAFEGRSGYDEDHEIGAALLPAILENPALLEPVENLICEMNRKIDELKDPALGYILRLALDGMHFTHMMGIGVIEDWQRKEVFKRMQQLVDEL
ncbi:TetR/AcrR family transcriptional regulator [Leptonema illini]|jgi:AcrR family transcriptional regulator|uniref:Transcriptional regulator, TetR family n=1 Tax=Leptonema illini DSM 21528 TaxID=929563 RepID=H2CDY8_9LEPT|nr:TetR/AcrR family transcriptional regulator [Leptonema illini]EHQ05507.1 transcriptional regulator, TetR family [Leptonema illini DSM 21528]